MAPRIALKREPPSSPERDALAVASQRFRDLAKQDEALTEALGGVMTDIANARRALANAERRVEEIEAAQVEAAMGRSVVQPDMSLPDARMAVIAATDKITALNAAQAKLQMASGPLAQSQIWAATALDEAVRQVLRTSPEAAALVGRLDIVRAEHLTLNAAVEYLALLGALPERVRLEEIKQNSEVEARWRAAVACLRTDCSALLPWSNPEPLKKDFDDGSNKN